MSTEISKDQTATQTPAKTAKKPLSPKTARRLAAVERTVYGAAGVVAAVGPQVDNPYLHLGAVGAGAGVLWRLWNKTKQDDPSGLMVSCGRSLPVLGLSGAYTASLVSNGTSWWEFVVPVGVAALSALAVPLTRARGVQHVVENLPTIVAEQAAAIPQQPDRSAGPTDPFTAGLVKLWAAAPSTGGTLLTQIHQYVPDRPDFEATILAPPGQAVPATLNERVIAAVFDIPEEAVELQPIPGSGPGRMAMRVAPSYVTAQPAGDGQEEGEPSDLESMWAAYVSSPSGAAPGVQLVKHRVEEHRITLWLAAPRGKTLRIDHQALCSALGVDDISRLVVEGAGPREALAYIYRTNPLLDVRQPTAEDLTMDDRGRISIGVSHDGSPARIQLFNHDTGRAQHGITAGTTGAGKSGLMRLFGAAQRLSGVISWMADVQGGMSMPEMDGRVDWFAKGQEETMQQLRALHAVKRFREAHSGGRGDFALNSPWRLIQWTGDEINRLLSSLDEKIRKEAAWMIGDLQKTGQKVGIGIDLAVQSLHLKELGDNHEIREKGKEGHVFLLRTASSSTQGMGLDGISPPGAHISPIPERIYEGGGAQELFEGTAATEGVPTPGMGWLITEGKAILFRTFVLEKVNGRYPQLEELMEAVPLPTLTPEEARAAGHAYAVRNGHAADADEYDVDQEDDVDGEPTEAARPLTLKERIRAVLVDEPEGLALKEIRAAVGCGEAGGPTTGSVNNAVSQLASDSKLIACGGGVYRLP